MKKVVTSIPTGGAPISDDILEREFNSEIWTAMESILQGVSPTAGTGNVGVIVSGGAVTGAGPYNCSAGIVYLNGQFMAFPGFVAQTLPQYIVPATLVTTQKTFGDGAAKNLLTQQDATFQSGVPGAGQYITLSTTGNFGGLGGFRMENYSNVATSALNDQLTAWITSGLTYPGTYVTGTVPFSYKKTGRGTVKLRGQIKNASGTNCADTFVTLPAGFRPAQQYVGVCNPALFAGRNYYRVVITTAGVVSVDQPGIALSSPMSTTEFSFDGIEFE